MKRAGWHSLLLVMLLAAMGSATTAHGQDDEQLARAKELFRHGVTLYESGDITQAIEYFHRSRELYPSSKNTINQAICLQELGRYDEALELYEETMTRFAGELSEEARAAVMRATRTLRPKIGEIEVASNVPGSLVIGSRPRGRLPLRTPVRVMPGKHVIRVLHQGYVTWEETVDVGAGEKRVVDARLEPLASAGGLRVEVANARDADVSIDGAKVGASPWEGMLAPGVHVVQSHDGDLVSLPMRVTVLQGQTTLVRLRPLPAASKVTLQVEPRSAEILLDDIPLADGIWEGVLPAGTFQLVFREEGYVTSTRRLALSTGEDRRRRLDVRLVIDPDHPRWPKPPPNRVWVEPWLGLAMAPSLRSGPEKRCPGDCSSDPPAFGWMAGARLGYETSAGVSFEVGGGYLSLRRSIERLESNAYPKQAPVQTVTYRLEDRIRLDGPFASAGASIEVPLGSLTLRSRVHAGVLFASSFDRLTGTASSGAESLEVGIGGAREEQSSTALFVMPELSVERTWGAWELGAGLGILFVPSAGPDFTHETITVPRDGCRFGDPTSTACAPVFDGIANERAYGPFWTAVPRVSVAHTF